MLIAITENPADIQLFDAIAKMGNQIEKKLVESKQFLVILSAEANQGVVELAHFRFPPTQGIIFCHDFGRILYEVLKSAYCVL